MVDPAPARGRVPGLRAGLILWAVFAAMVLGISGAQHFRRSVTGTYFGAACQWLAGGDLYGSGIHGFLYAPHAAIAAIPFAVLNPVVADVLWRVVLVTVTVQAVWRISCWVAPRPDDTRFLVISLMTIPLAASSARNGQMNLAMMALFIHSAVDLSAARWWRATAWLWIAVLLKPPALAMALLAAVAYPQAAWRLAVTLPAVAALPFAAQQPAYVMEQYRLFVGKMRVASDPAAVHDLFNDLFGLLATLGVEVSHGVEVAVRGVAAVGTAVAVFAVRRRDGWQRAVVVLNLSVCYLMLFNPRTEANSYVMIAPLMGVFAVWAFAGYPTKATGWVGVITIVLLAFTGPIAGADNHWLKPLIAAAFLGYVLWMTFTRRLPAIAAASQT